MKREAKTKQEEKLMEHFGFSSIADAALRRGEVVASEVFCTRARSFLRPRLLLKGMATPQSLPPTHAKPKTVTLTERELALVCAMALVGADR